MYTKRCTCKGGRQVAERKPEAEGRKEPRKIRKRQRKGVEKDRKHINNVTTVLVATCAESHTCRIGFQMSL